MLQVVRSWISSWLAVYSVVVVVFVLRVSADSKNSQQQDDGPMLERDRLIGYYKLFPDGQWPPPISMYVPNTPGWASHMRERLLRLDSATGNRWDGYVQTLYAGLYAPNFTHHGFGVCPQCVRDLDWFQSLQQTVIDAYRLHVSGERRLNEEQLGATDGPVPDWFLPAPELVSRTLHELEPYAEAWSKQSLTPHGAYGMRLYRNSSRLYMHLDRIETHVVSIILHIGSSSASLPWPLYIEDFHGRTHALYMQPGDILFYESSKVLHGRPEPFHGDWFTSIFCHYFPTNFTAPVQKARYAVPPHWRDRQLPPNNFQHPRLDLRYDSFVEQSCPNGWCATSRAIPWKHHHNRSPPPLQQQTNWEDLTWLDADGLEHPLNLLTDNVETTISSTMQQFKTEDEL